MSGPRELVAALWCDLGVFVRLVCVRWPCRNSPSHIAIAQFELEVEKARRASGEKDECE